MSDAAPVAVSILDREFLVACTPEERPGLIAAAAYLDGKMREVRGNTRTQGVDRIAVMAGLNIAHELMQARARGDVDGAALAQQVQALRAKLDGALATPLK
ncbi:MAG: cell division protein ZapA [Gammaproteobacteria bacterium]|nr:MAG: cell division protein ZapA [Gammaproteobacteria bacterium]